VLYVQVWCHCLRNLNAKVQKKGGSAKLPAISFCVLVTIVEHTEARTDGSKGSEVEVDGAD
jgi:hypothetical protein